MAYLLCLRSRLAICKVTSNFINWVGQYEIYYFLSFRLRLHYLVKYDGKPMFQKSTQLANSIPQSIKVKKEKFTTKNPSNSCARKANRTCGVRAGTVRRRYPRRIYWVNHRIHYQLILRFIAILWRNTQESFPQNQATTCQIRSHGNEGILLLQLQANEQQAVLRRGPSR